MSSAIPEFVSLVGLRVRRDYPDTIYDEEGDEIGEVFRDGIVEFYQFRDGGPVLLTFRCDDGTAVCCEPQRAIVLDMEGYRERIQRMNPTTKEESRDALQELPT